MPRLTLHDFDSFREGLKAARDKLCVKVGMSTCGLAAGAEAVFAAAQEACRSHAGWRVSRTGCAGMCSQEPLVEISQPDQAPVLYGGVTPEFMRELVAARAPARCPPRIACPRSPNSHAGPVTRWRTRVAPVNTALCSGTAA